MSMLSTAAAVSTRGSTDQIATRRRNGTGPGDTVARLVRDLLPSEQAEEVLRGFYTDAFHERVLERLSVLRGNVRVCKRSRISPLPKWKLRRIELYVDARIDERITLTDLASCAGISEMHFAAQFKLATGQRPHDYVVHRRIHRARRMILETKAPLSDVGLAVGFRTQSHFTTVFKRLVGMTPNVWRAAMIDRQESSRPATGGPAWAPAVGGLHPEAFAA